MKITLISSIGRGQKDHSGTAYKKVAYSINGKTCASTAFFVSAWINSPEGNAIDEVKLIGTATSSWDTFAEEIGDDELWLSLESLCSRQDSTGANDRDLVPLAEALSDYWDRSVSCHVLCHQVIDDSNAAEISRKLIELFPLADNDRMLHLDTTHALRTLPLLALSAIATADAYYPGFSTRTRLIYGELFGDTGRGIALDSILRQHLLAKATNAFFEAFDAEPLTTLLPDECCELNKALRGLANCIQLNLFDQLKNRVRDLRRFMHQAPEPTLHKKIEDLTDQLKQDSLSDRLIALANLRAQRRHFGPAILALAEAASAIACPQRQPTYEALQDVKLSYFKSLTGPMQEKWNTLHKLRNRVAHGANISEAPENWDALRMEQAFSESMQFVKTLPHS